METTSVVEQERSARHELSVFMDRFKHLAEGTAVLSRSEIDEDAEDLLHTGVGDCQAEINPREGQDSVFNHPDCQKTSSEQVRRPVQDLKAALNIMDLAIEQLWLEKNKAASLQAQLLTEQQLHRLRSEKDSLVISEWISRYKQIFAENVHLRAQVATY